MDRLNAIRVFVRVVETGSLTAAARHERISQPSASKAIAQLEEWTGAQLLLRSTRMMTMTEAGHNFMARAQRILEESDEALREARGSDAGLSGCLRVSASVCFARLHIVPRLPEFMDTHPDLDVELALDDRYIDLIEGGIDVALRMGELADSGMTARPIAQARRLVVATPAYFQRHGTPQTPADLLDHRAVLYTHGGNGTAWTFRNGAMEQPVVINGRLRVNAADGLRAAVMADMGLAVVSEWAFTPELQSGAMVAVLQDWTLPPVNLSAVFPSGRQISRKAREFVAFVDSILA